MKHKWIPTASNYDRCENCGKVILIGESGDGRCRGNNHFAGSDNPKTMNTPVTTEFDLAVVASGYAFTERERHIAEHFYDKGKHGRSKHGFG